jgi:hypothetical protein
MIHIGDVANKKILLQEAQKGCPARPQRVKQAEVEVQVERRSDSFFLSLDLSLNLLKAGRFFSASCKSPQ